MTRTLTLLAALAVTVSGTAQTPKLDAATAEENLRKARNAVKATDSTLKLLSKAMYVGSILTQNPDLKEVGRFTDSLRKPANEIKKHSDKLVELAEKQKDKKDAEREAKSLLEKVKLVRIENQADELERLAKKVRELPIGLVTEKVDDKFMVSSDLLVRDPKQAEARFKAYLAAIETNVDYLKSKNEQLEEASKIAKAAKTFFAKVQSGIEKSVMFSGIYAKPLTESYKEMDGLIKAYGDLASDCVTKAKQAKQAAEIERRRHDALKDTVKTLFGFRL